MALLIARRPKAVSKAAIREHLWPGTFVSDSSWLIGASAEVALLPGENVIGREGDGVILVKSSTVSRRHARIAVDAAGAVIEDLGSKNGTYVNDHRVDTTIAIVDGDQIRIGSLLFTFRLPQGNETTETQSSRSGRRLCS